MQAKILLRIVVVLLVVACSTMFGHAQIAQVPSAGLGRGVNLGNALEAPNEGDWGVVLTPEIFDRVASLGFDHIRLPVSWTNHTQTEAPYSINEEFLDRVEWAIDQAVSRDMKVIVNVHHYEEIHADPVGEQPRALAMWEQIANRFSGYTDEDVVFEVLNEAHGQFTESPELWNMHVQLVLNVIRQSNPTRKVMVGPPRWNSISFLESLVLPDDPNLIATFHFYDPFVFTHQGATWIDPVLPTGVRWLANLSRIQPGYQNHSWDTEVQDAAGGVKVQFNRQYAGYLVHCEQTIENATHLVFSSNRAMEMQLRVRSADGTSGAVNITTTAGQKSYVINLADEGMPADVKEVQFQLFDEEPGPTWRNKILFVKTADGERHHLVRSMGFAVETLIGQAAEWAIENDVPIYLGEFGVHDQANLKNRFKWTRKVRIECEKRGIDWGYWSLAESMGFYNPVTDEVDEFLLRAILPEYGR